MGTHQYKFSYTPQYSDLLYIGFLLIGGGTIALLKNPLFIPLVWIFVVAGIYLFIKKKPKIFFYEDFIEVTKGIGKSKNITAIKYSDVQYIEYCFSEMGRGNLFKIFFLQNGSIKCLQYTFMGNPTSFEVSFFKEKRILIKLVPESARYKLPGSVSK